MPVIFVFVSAWHSLSDLWSSRVSKSSQYRKTCKLVTGNQFDTTRKFHPRRYLMASMCLLTAQKRSNELRSGCIANALVVERTQRDGGYLSTELLPSTILQRPPRQMFYVPLQLLLGHLLSFLVQCSKLPCKRKSSWRIQFLHWSSSFVHRLLS